MKKILFVESYPQAMFGQQRTLLYLLEHCAAAGVEPLVAAPSEGPFTEEVRRRGIPLALFPYPESLAAYGGAIYGAKGFRFLRMMGQWLEYVGRIRSRLRTFSLDGVYCNDMRALLTAGIAARLCGLPVMVWNKLDKPHGWMDWLQLPLVQECLVISKAVTQKYPRWQAKMMKRKLFLVHEGVALDRYNGVRSIRPALGLGDGEVVLAIVGAITERKGHDRIFSIWPELAAADPRLRLLVVGATGGEADESFLASLPHRDHPGIYFLGMREDIPEIMASLDILVAPSRHEGFGLVLVEAMAAGKPVVGSDVGGIPEVVVNEETGLVVRGDDPGAWKRAIGRLASSPELRDKMGQAGRKRVEAEFNRPIQMRKVLDLLLEMTHGR